MNRIIKIGMDVHSKIFALCALESHWGEKDRILATTQVPADYRNVISFIDNLNKKMGSSDTYDIECGYEAGCLGYSLHNQLEAHHVKCTILAPSTMLTQQGKRVKTDSRDAVLIAQCLAWGGYHSVHVPTAEDDAMKEFIRMRDAHKAALKRIKQQINAFCMRHGLVYERVKWTQTHEKWLKNINLPGVLQETLNEYLATYFEERDKVERFDKRIEDLAMTGSHSEEIKHLICLRGVKVHTAAAILSEVGDLHRFAKGNTFAAYLGLAPGEHSSGDKINHTGISKAGNSHLRRLLIEAAKGLCKGKIGFKSKALKARQKGNPADILAYADRANIRLLGKYYRMIRRDKKANVAVAAVARELACFIWGMATGNIGPRVTGTTTA